MGDMLPVSDVRRRVSGPAEHHRHTTTPRATRREGHPGGGAFSRSSLIPLQPFDTVPNGAYTLQQVLNRSRRAYPHLSSHPASQEGTERTRRDHAASPRHP